MLDSGTLVANHSTVHFVLFIKPVRRLCGENIHRITNFCRRLFCFDFEHRMRVLAVALVLFAAAPHSSSSTTTLDDLISSTACVKQGTDAVVCTFGGTVILGSDA